MKLEMLTVNRPMSGVLSRKYVKLDSLLCEFADMLEREREIDDMPKGRERSRLSSELYDEMKELDKKIGKIWDTLSPEQQVELFNNTRTDLQYVYDGF
jgi:hypothetical protein